MICSEFDKLTAMEKSVYIGELVHSVQSDSGLFERGKTIIEAAKEYGLFEKVTILPPTEEFKPGKEF